MKIHNIFNKEEWSIIERMKAYLQCWYVINQLYHFLFKTGDEFELTEQDDFMRWCVGEDIKNRPNHWYSYIPPKKGLRKFIHRLFAFVLLRNPSNRRLREGAPEGYREHEEKKLLKWIINECQDPHLNLIKKSSTRIGLTAKGRVECAFSYLWLRNSYAKQIWTGVFIALLTAIIGFYLSFITNKITKAIPQTIEIKYVPNE